MTHVGIDLRVLDAPGMELSGLGRYGVEVTRALQAARPDWRFTLHSSRTDLFGASVRRTRWPTARPVGRIGWLHAGAAATTLRDRPDLWFSPSFVLPLWWRGPAVVAVHDLVFELLRGRYRGRLNGAYASRATRWSARRADRVLCGSQETKAHLVRRFSVAGERVGVVPYAVADVFRADPVCDPELRGDFLLFVGVFEARKGLDTLHEALHRLRDAGRQVPIVVAGRPGWGTETVLDALRKDPDVSFRIEPSDGELADLYRRALALVYPSRMEGFGLPVAEAMALGCPVVASELGCIREFAGVVPL
jgi:glycosyltransferase involved in cell wall biosynthesis